MSFQGLTTSVLDRSSDVFKVVKPLFHFLALSREKKEMFNFFQSDNMGKYKKEKELHELNGFVRAHELNNMQNKTRNNH